MRRLYPDRFWIDTAVVLGAFAVAKAGALWFLARAWERRRGKAGARREIRDVTTSDPAVESFLAVSRARLAPRTVESYSRDLEDFGRALGRPGLRRDHGKRSKATSRT